MLGTTTTRQVTELRELLARGAPHGLPRLTIGDTLTADAELAVHVLLANLDRLRHADDASRTRRALVEEHIRRAHQAVTAALAR